ncbi:hypothetical protein L1887_59231 [Cichorium endivia]|nr:hypothetical protein L1887_59231 [Cichorium endivia]
MAAWFDQCWSEDGLSLSFNANQDPDRENPLDDKARRQLDRPKVGLKRSLEESAQTRLESSRGPRRCNTLFPTPCTELQQRVIASPSNYIIIATTVSTSISHPVAAMSDRPHVVVLGAGVLGLTRCLRAARARLQSHHPRA